MALAPAATVSPQATVLGPTPEVLGCNAGHHFPGGNTIDWWRYSGVNGARMFISPWEIEPSDDIAPVGDGVGSETSFMTRRAALRADPLNPQFIKWSVFEGNYATRDLHPVNHIRTDPALAELRAAGIEICAQITASDSRFPLSGPSDWPGLWELWQHFYAQAFHLARHHDVRRFQMYNEPDAVPVAEADYLLRLRICSDAVQCAVADVNTRYGKSLVARVHAPVNAGNAVSDFTNGLGGAAVANRHVTVLGTADPLYQNIHVYDYHQYDGSPSGYASSLAGLHSLLDAAMTPEPRLPTCISEFNVHTGANFDNMPETLDSPVKYARLGAILPRLAAEGIAEMYLFKFAQTVRSGGNYPVAKNALHYSDNSNAPYPVGGITQGGEVWRLFTKASASGGQRLAVLKDSEAGPLEVQATLHPTTGVRHVYCANNTSGALPLAIDFTAWSTPPGTRVRVEEVGDACRGGVANWFTVDASRRIEGVIGAYTVWLVTLPANAPATEDIVPASADATVRDGVHVLTNFGTQAALEARNDPAGTSLRAAALLGFPKPVIHPPDILSVTLAAEVSTTAGSPCQAHVYGLDDDSWSETTVNWSNAPNLRDNIAAGAQILHAVTEGGGTGAHIQGQWQANPGPPATLRLDVTRFFRSQSDSALTFLVVQDPRWDVALPSLETGDVQAAGISLLSREAAPTVQQRPRLHILRKLDTDGDGISDSAESAEFGTSPSLADTDGDGVSDGIEILVNGTDPRETTPIPVVREATIRGGSFAADNIDESSYLMVKHSGDLNFSRKSYFQFDLPASGVDLDGPATLWLRFTNSYPQRVRLWGITQAAPEISSALTWNDAPGNDTASNSMLTAGAAAIGASVLIEPGVETPRPPKALAIPRLGDFVTNGRVTLAVCPESDPSNHNSGLRIQPAAATLQFRVAAVPPDPPLTLWKKEEFGEDWNQPAIAGETMDPDRDGLVNLLEYALGGDPLAAASRGTGPSVGVSAAAVEFRFDRDPSRDDIDLIVQQAESPAGPWLDIAVSIGGGAFAPLVPGVTALDQGAGPRIQVIVSIPDAMAAPSRFLRLKATGAG